MVTLLLIISLLGAPSNISIGPRVNIARVSFLKPSGVSFFTYGGSDGHLIMGSRFDFQRGDNIRLSVGLLQHSFMVNRLKFTRSYGLFSIQYQGNILGGKVSLRFDQVFPVYRSKFWKN